MTTRNKGRGQTLRVDSIRKHFLCFIHWFNFYLCHLCSFACVIKVFHSRANVNRKVHAAVLDLSRSLFRSHQHVCMLVEDASKSWNSCLSNTEFISEIAEIRLVKLQSEHFSTKSERNRTNQSIKEAEPQPRFSWE